MTNDRHPHRKGNQRSIALAFAISAASPGMGSWYAGNFWTGARSAVLFWLAFWSAQQTVAGLILAILTWLLSLWQTEIDVFTINRGYRDSASYFRGFDEGQEHRRHFPVHHPTTLLVDRYDDQYTARALTEDYNYKIRRNDAGDLEFYKENDNEPEQPGPTPGDPEAVGAPDHDPSSGDIDR